MISEYLFNQSYEHYSVNQIQNSFGQLENVFISQGILMGETPTQPKNQTLKGQGNTPDFGGSTANTYQNLRLEPTQFGTDDKQIKQGDLLLWDSGNNVKRVFVIESTHKDIDFEIGQMRYWRAYCTIQNTKHQINP